MIRIIRINSYIGITLSPDERQKPHDARALDSPGDAALVLRTNAGVPGIDDLRLARHKPPEYLNIAVVELLLDVLGTKNALFVDHRVIANNANWE